MKSLKLLLLICFICFGKTYGYVIKNYGQVIVEIIKEKNNIFTKVEVFGISDKDSAWVENLKKNIVELIGDGKEVEEGKYNVLIKFIVSKDGSLCDIICETDPGFGICEKVIRVVKKSKSWRSSEPIQVREFPSMKLQ